MTVTQIKLSEVSDALENTMEKGIEKIRAAVVAGCYQTLGDIIKSSPVDTGLYAQSWAVTEEEESVFLGNYAPHAPIIEYGARPFRPPLGPLLAWAKRVLKDASQPPEYSSHVWALAKYTQAKIEKEGILPMGVMAKNINTLMDNIRNELAAMK